MSLNIPNVLVDVCSSVVLNIDTNMLGPRQIKATQRMAKTGVLKGYSAPMMIARALRKKEGLPTIHYRASNFRWYSMKGNDDFFNRLQAISVAMQMGNPDASWRIEAINSAVDDRPEIGLVHILEKTAKHIMKTLVLPPYERFTEGIFYIDAKEFELL